MRFKMKKITAIVMSVAMLFLCCSFTSVNAEPSFKSNSQAITTIYSEIVDDFIQVTNISVDTADNLFNVILDESSARLYEELTEKEYLEAVCLQEKYLEVVEPLSSDDQYGIHKKFLEYAIRANLNIGTTLTDSNIGQNAVLSSGAVELRIYADSSGSASSSNTSGRAWITMRAYSPSDAGKLFLPPSSTATLGTWGNKLEHIGIWYNLESYFVQQSSSNYPNRAYLSMTVTSSDLDALNNYIINHDTWSLTNNCSSFASACWNLVAPSNMQVSAGLINTPSNLRSSIINKGGIQDNPQVAIPYFGTVYYANGTGAITPSTEFK